MPVTPSKPQLLLAIGTPLNLQVLPDRSGARLSARVLGMCEGESIIAHVPGATFTPIELRPDDEVAVRCLEGRAVYGFKTAVIRVCTSPYPYFHLAWPSVISRAEVRQSERVSVAIPVEVKSASGAAMRAELRDLSGSGALLVAPAALGADGDSIELAFELNLNEFKRTLQIRASIRSAADLPPAAGDELRHRCGVQFLDLSQDDKLFLLGFVYERLAAARGASSSNLAQTPQAA
jgi:c-di-GMP-binding flagellar brake protein YcgR